MSCCPVFCCRSSECDPFKHGNAFLSYKTLSFGIKSDGFGLDLLIVKQISTHADKFTIFNPPFGRSLIFVFAPIIKRRFPNQRLVWFF